MKNIELRRMRHKLRKSRAKRARRELREQAGRGYFVPFAGTPLADIRKVFLIATWHGRSAV